MKESRNRSLLTNALLMFMRMILTMGIGLFTSRIILGILGVTDYGVYNVVAGIISMFAFLNSSMTSATQRYITFSIGAVDRDEIQKVFTTSVRIHLLLSALIVLLGETVGLWYLYHKVVIPRESLGEAFWVFQCSIATAVLGIMSIPYNATIIAHERFSAFAYISIFEAGAKLLVVLLLWFIPFRKLVLYAVLLLTVQTALRIYYIYYCRKNFPDSRYRRGADPKLLKEMGSFAGWSFFGNIAFVLNGEGLNQMLNLFFGPAVNAARSLALQLQTAVQQLASNFQVVINPKITKAYASGDLGNTFTLMYTSTRVTFTLIFMIVLPILIETPYILRLWLRTVPEYTVGFTRLMLGLVMLNPFSSPCSQANQATGNVRRFQLIVGSLLLTVVPLSYAVLKLGGDPPSVYSVFIAVEAGAVCIRIFLLNRQIGFPVGEYFRKVVLRLLPIVLLGPALPLLAEAALPESFGRLIIVTGLSLISIGVLTYILGLTAEERRAVGKKLKMVLIKLKHKTEAR